MGQQLDRRHTQELIGKLRARIRKLDDDQKLAMRIAAYFPTNKRTNQGNEDRGIRLIELRRELLHLIQSQKTS